MNLMDIDIPKIDDDIVFENLTKDLLNANPSFNLVNINGRSGQKQFGVDVFARKKDNLAWIGVQCKVRSTNKSFTKDELLNEINQAKKFNPILSEYFLYTTLSRDSRTQKIERALNEELSKEGCFVFQVLFWDDIANKLREKTYEDVYFKYYSKFFRDNLTFGHAIGKLVNLALQFDNDTDTHCELIIGKVPPYNNNTATNVDYYRGTYFIINLHNKKIEFFNKIGNSEKVSCYPSDICYAFENQIDCYRICKWLTALENIDRFIYDDKHDCKFSITTQERHNYFDTLSQNV